MFVRITACVLSALGLLILTYLSPALAVEATSPLAVEATSRSLAPALNSDCGHCSTWLNPDYTGSCTNPTWYITIGYDHDGPSGVCREDPCGIQTDCNNTGTVTVTPKAGYYINGGSENCSTATVSLSTPVTACDTTATSTYTIHSGTPCTAQNKVCTLVMAKGCTYCIPPITE